METWTDTFQRGVLSAVLDGTLPLRPRALELFTEDRRGIALAISSFQKLHDLYPSRQTFADLSLGWTKEERLEARAILAVPEDYRAHARAAAAEALTREALRDASLRLAELAEEEPSRWAEGPRYVEEALQVAQNGHHAFRAPGSLLDLLTEDQGGGARWMAPTGIRTLDRALGGGLEAGQLGYLLGPTERGKTHLLVVAGVAAIRAGIHVLHVTLENAPGLVFRRYVRSYLDRTAEELEGVRPEPMGYDALAAGMTLLGYPAGSIGPATIEEQVKNVRRDRPRVLVLVDYGKLLSPQGRDQRHKEIADVHLKLRTIAHTYHVPIWTPFQTNRMGHLDTEGDVGLGYAGDSYESMQHADLVLGLNQDKRDVQQNRLRISIEKSRETPKCYVTLKYDWTKSTVWELLDGKPTAEDPAGDGAGGGPQDAEGDRRQAAH